MIPIYQFADLSPDQILNRDIQAEADVGAAVDEILTGVREGGDVPSGPIPAGLTGRKFRIWKSPHRKSKLPGPPWIRTSAPRWSWQRRTSAISTANRSTGTLWWRTGPAL